MLPSSESAAPVRVSWFCKNLSKNWAKFQWVESGKLAAAGQRAFFNAYHATGGGEAPCFVRIMATMLPPPTVVMISLSPDAEHLSLKDELRAMEKSRAPDEQASPF